MAWRPLRLCPQASAQLPVFLVSTAVTSSTFAVHLTDLKHIWSESLDRAAIVSRSREEDTSIVPSDGAQLRILLEKIRLGLEGADGTALALTINPDAARDADRPSLILNVSVDLPGDFAALEWPVRLGAAPQSVMASCFTIPLLQSQHASAQEVRSLTQELKDKDHVILKLLDKLEEQHTELGQIWPQAAGGVGRKVSRRKAEEKVKGVAPFDLDSWRKELSHEAVEDTAELVSQLFAKQISVYATGQTPEGEEEWWDGIKGMTVNLNSGKCTTSGGKAWLEKQKANSPALKKAETQDGDEDAFQVQSTPPVAPASKPTSSTILDKTEIDDATASDDDGLDFPSQASKIPDSFPRSSPRPSPSLSPSPSPKPARGKLGTASAKKPALPPSSSPAPGASPNDDDNDDSTADETSPFPEKANRASPLPPPVPVPAVQRARKTPLGKIGANKAPAPPPDPPPPAPGSSADTLPNDNDAHATPPRPKPKRGRLGHIGRHKEQDAGPGAASPKRKSRAIGTSRESPETQTVVDSVEEQARARPDSGGVPLKMESSATPEPRARETSTERADRRREVLRRELEEAKARVPVRKKRRF